MRGADGTLLDIAVTCKDTCSFSVEGELFEGKLVNGDSILWSDGARWVRAGPPHGAGAPGAAAPGARPEEEPERRKADDGQHYTKEQFREFYGSGDARWDAAAPTAPPPDQEAEQPGDRIEVVVRHATEEDARVRVLLPRRARFKHVRRALAKLLGGDEALQGGLLSHKVEGRYRACKELCRVGDTRQVLLARVDLAGATSSGAAVELCEGEVSAEEAEEEVLVDDEDERAAASSQQAAAGSSSSSSKNVPFTRDRAVALQKELKEAFGQKGFQQKLDSLDRKYGALDDSIASKQERQEVFLSVQSMIIPKYGFEGTAAGVLSMMGAMGPFISDPEVIQLGRDINKLLGIRSRPDSWSKLSKTCQELDEAEKKAVEKKKNRRLQRHELVHMVPEPEDGVDEAPAVLRLLQPPRAAPVDVAIPEDSLGFEQWPKSKRQPFKLYIAGTWNDYKMTEMHWQQGLFVSSVTVGENNWESFQLVKDRKWERAIYPSIPDAGPFEEHTVCGPDGDGHGKNWMIGRFIEEEASPGKQFAVIAALDTAGSVRMVHWQHMK